MKVLSIGTDRKLFEVGSAVLSRNLEYASEMQELHIVVFSLKSHNLKETVNKNLYIYPTNSSSRFFYIIDAIKIGKKLIKREGFSSTSTVITCQDPFETGIVGYFLKSKFHLPLQLQVHTDFLSSYFKNNILNKIRVFISKFVIPKADGIRVVSSVILDSIKKEFPNLKAKFDILPVFVDVEKFFKTEEELNESKKLFSVVMISRFTKEKRIDIGLEAFRKVISQKKDASMLLVGSGSEKQNIEKKITELNLWSNIKVLEWEKDVVQAYKKADIFLLTSEYEGYGMTLIEAGAAGIPIVTTNVGIAQTSLFKDGFNTFICPVGDVDCLSEKLIDLITNFDKRKLFKERMQDSIKSVSISKKEYVLKYVDIIKQLIK